MKLSDAIKKMQYILIEKGDMEFICYDADGGWSWVIEDKHITYYNGVCEIYAGRNIYDSSVQHYHFE